jgi:hypothetical protein
MSLGTASDQLPNSPRLTSAQPPTAAQRNHLRPLEVAQCSLCGIARPLGLMVPDGGQACADIRWYCKDTISCTERWVAAQRHPTAYIPATPRPAPIAAAEPARDEAGEQPDVLEAGAEQPDAPEAKAKQPDAPKAAKAAT